MNLLFTIHNFSARLKLCFFFYIMIYFNFRIIFTHQKCFHKKTVHKIQIVQFAVHLWYFYCWLYNMQYIIVLAVLMIPIYSCDWLRRRRSKNLHKYHYSSTQWDMTELNWEKRIWNCSCFSNLNELSATNVSWCQNFEA